MIVIFYHGNLKGLSDESIKPFTTSNKIFNPSLDYVDHKIRVKFRGDSLKQEKTTISHGKIVNIYIVYEIVDYHPGTSYPTLENFYLVQSN